jgi:N-acetylglucosamine-6-phosphate deacetylase
MQDIVITNAVICTDGHTHNRWLWCRSGKIEAYGRGDPAYDGDPRLIDAGGMTLIPGYVDIHVHGAAGVDVMDATPEALAKMARFYAQHGVTSFLATTWTDTREHITAALQNAAQHIGPFEGGATLRGVHLEGPYLNPKKSGAQNKSYVRRAQRQEAMPWLNMNVIRLLALAPEYEENHWLIEDCAARGITVAAAHTDATYEEIVHAASLGLTHSTHTFNAMSALHHRRPGTVGAALAIPQMTCEIIADNIHVHPAVLRLLWNAKQFQNVVLISDAIRAAGMPDGDYPVDERTVYVRDGVAQLEDGTLAGSTLTMDVAVRNFLAATNSTIDVIYETATIAPAGVAGIADVTGSIAQGKDADLVLLDDDCNVRMTMAQGRVVYEA